MNRCEYDRETGNCVEIDGDTSHHDLTDFVRQNLTIDAVQVRFNLKKMGLLRCVNHAIKCLPEDSDMRILWEHAPIFHRNNPVLIQFCKIVLNINDTQIDELFL